MDGGGDRNDNESELPGEMGIVHRIPSACGYGNLQMPPQPFTRIYVGGGGGGDDEGYTG